ncbi:MAG: NAD(P)-dependent oxidoreductase [Burkholderiales bacterium]
MKPAVGIVGLGIMGSAMAEALLAHGYRVTGYDIRAEACRRLKKAGGEPLASATAVAASAEIVITSLATAAALAATVAKIAEAGRAGLLVIETSTLPLAAKDRARRTLRRTGIATLDCPISGTAVRMKEGAWTIFASGSRAAFKRAQPVLGVFTQKVPYVGAYGNGTRMKFSANHMVAILNVATAEALTFARKMGLDPRQVWELFATSPVIGNGVYRLRGKLMIEGRYRPATMKVEVWQKDMQVIGEMARSVDCPTPLFSACEPLYSAAMGRGLGQSDTASVCEVLGAMAGIERRRGKR